MDTVGSQQPLKKLGTGIFGIVVTLVGFMISAPAGASDVSVRGASCTLVRYYVAMYSAPAAEAWAKQGRDRCGDQQSPPLYPYRTGRPH
jgi:hypothetical protein